MGEGIPELIWTSKAETADHATDKEWIVSGSRDLTKQYYCHRPLPITISSDNLVETSCLAGGAEEVGIGMHLLTLFALIYRVLQSQYDAAG